jgi:hypothetical protein
MLFMVMQAGVAALLTRLGAPLSHRETRARLRLIQLEGVTVSQASGGYGSDEP